MATVPAAPLALPPIVARIVGLADSLLAHLDRAEVGKVPAGKEEANGRKHGPVTVRAAASRVMPAIATMQNPGMTAPVKMDRFKMDRVMGGRVMPVRTMLGLTQGDRGMTIHDPGASPPLMADYHVVIISHVLPEREHHSVCPHRRSATVNRTLLAPRPTRPRARSGCTVTMRLLPRLPIRTAGCAAYC